MLTPLESVALPCGGVENSRSPALAVITLGEIRAARGSDCGAPRADYAALLIATFHQGTEHTYNKGATAIGDHSLAFVPLFPQLQSSGEEQSKLPQCAIPRALSWSLPAVVVPRLRRPSCPRFCPFPGS